MRRERVIITGGTGQLGRALERIAPAAWDITALSSTGLDVSDWRAVRDCFAGIRPTLVLHAAAATDVDRCEREPEWAYQVNATGSRNVAQAARLIDARMVHLSTNYVFDGHKDSPYHEFDTTNPISVYGASKLAAEREVEAAGPALIVRTAWLYGPGGRNFVSTMRRLMNERESLSVVDDQTGNPTSTHDLASAIVQLLDSAPSGVYHAVNRGTATWFDWAIEIRDRLNLQTAIERIPAAEYRRDAAPPTNGVLSSLVLPGLGIELPDWRDALIRCLAT